MTILACDLGCTRMKIGVVRGGRVLAQSVEPVHSHQGLAPQLPVLKAAWRRLLMGQKLSLADCLGVTVAVPSLVDRTTGWHAVARQLHEATALSRRPRCVLVVEYYPGVDETQVHGAIAQSNFRHVVERDGHPTIISRA